jgi:hypothetical protein
MQLKKRHLSIRGALAAATCSVLSQPLQASSTTGPDEWDVKTGLLSYSESGRVNIVEPVASATKVTDSGAILTLRALFDSITGSSPTGAAPAGTAQTFTSPSGNNTYTTSPGDLPMRDMRDRRYAFGIDYEHELSRLYTNTVTADISSETDYFSLGFSDTVKRDLNNRLTTLTAGIGYTLDTVKPSGGVPLEMELLSNSATDGESKTKNTASLVLGLTQILSRRALTQVNLSYNSSSGYLTEPYKFLSVVDPVTGLPTTDPVADPSNPNAYRYEKRPDSRNSMALFWKWQYQLPEDVVYLSYRYFNDDWGITSHTADVKYRYELGGGMYLQPHMRLYQQTAADFYQPVLLDGPLPQYASADLRLGEMTSRTIGVKYGMPLGNGEFSARLEQMVQEGTSHPSASVAPGDLQNYDLYPTLTATIFQLGYRFKF